MGTDRAGKVDLHPRHRPRGCPREHGAVCPGSGRAAFHLQATFPADLAKEASWDVFVDRDTGIIARFRVNPLPGEEGYEQIVETVSVSH